MWKSRLKLHKILIQAIAVLGVGLGLLGVGTVTANASSKGYYGCLQSRKITYHIDSKSKHWKDNWNGAVKAWNKLHVIKLRSIKKASKADIRLTTVKNLKGNYEMMGYTNGPGGYFGIFSSKVKLNRKAMVNYTEQDKERTALMGVGYAVGLNYSDDKTSALSGFADKPSAKDKANLKKAYKHVK
ncbi:hypothetical protein IV54_GL000908 [Levilactobacillus paucivorans]|uniref:Uncharacterized protein n=1 Tax=Levilactobacillus paucivorans TaxID=616990 RepID=A0A0R2LXF4_9LACO|nr:hypothetical protein IV54_GL000908 [Levilactobacillus paucivorans]